MKKVSIGLVSEGKSDFQIFRWCLAEALLTEGITATFRRIHPVHDSTSGTYTEGGWRKVYQWCLRNKLGDRARFFEGGLFEGAEDDLDVILVHLDGDIHRHFGIQFPGNEICPVDPASCSDQPDGRFQFCRDLVETWLFRGADPSSHDSCAASPTVMATEAWLIGGLGYHPSPEILDNPKSDFARLWLLNTGRLAPPNMRKLKNHVYEVEQAVASRRPDMTFSANNTAFLHAVTTVTAYSRS